MFVTAVSRIACSAAGRATPRIRATRGSVRCLSIGDELKRKEKVEEDLYIREQEKKFYEKKKAEKAAAEHDHELAVFSEVVAPAMVEVQELLKASGDSLSDAGLEAIAKWKLGI